MPISRNIISIDGWTIPGLRSFRLDVKRFTSGITFPRYRCLLISPWVFCWSLRLPLRKVHYLHKNIRLTFSYSILFTELCHFLQIAKKLSPSKYGTAEVTHCISMSTYIKALGFLSLALHCCFPLCFPFWKRPAYSVPAWLCALYT